MVNFKLLFSIILALKLYTVSVNAQQTEGQFIHKGLLRATSTFATGYMPYNKVNNLYLTGIVEYYTDSKISLRGESFYFFNSLNGDKTFKQNHSIFSGACYHLKTNSHFDPFIGLQTGLAYSQIGRNFSGNAGSNKSFNPLLSPLIGFNYYAPKWFHLFINARYVIGNHLSEQGIIPLNEWNFSFGLGFNIL